MVGGSLRAALALAFLLVVPVASAGPVGDAYATAWGAYGNAAEPLWGTVFSPPFGPVLDTVWGSPAGPAAAAAFAAEQDLEAQASAMADGAAADMDGATGEQDLYDRETTAVSVGETTGCWVRAGDVECWAPPGGAFSALQDPHPAKTAVAVSVRGSSQDALPAPPSSGPDPEDLCVLYDDGTAACWHEEAGTVGSTYLAGDAVAVEATGIDGTVCILRSSGDVLCGGALAYAGGDAVQMDLGGRGLCIVTSAGHVRCSDGSTDLTGDAVQVVQGPNHICILRADGSFDCDGDNEFGQAADYSGSGVVALDAFAGSTCARTAAGNTWCQGGMTCTSGPHGDDCAPSSPPASYQGGDVALHAAGGRGQCWRFEDGTFHCTFDAPTYGYQGLDLGSRRLAGPCTPTPVALVMRCLEL